MILRNEYNSFQMERLVTLTTAMERGFQELSFDLLFVGFGQVHEEIRRIALSRRFAFAEE